MASGEKPPMASGPRSMKLAQPLLHLGHVLDEAAQTQLAGGGALGRLLVGESLDGLAEE